MAGALLAALRANRIDVTSAFGEGRLGLPDDLQLAWATENSRAIVTANKKHFPALHNAVLAEGRYHAGIIVISEQRSPVGAQLRASWNSSGSFPVTR
jgi:hypothetical protein